VILWIGGQDETVHIEVGCYNIIFLLKAKKFIVINMRGSKTPSGMSQS
jgi:hypothetical protein